MRMTRPSLPWMLMLCLTLSTTGASLAAGISTTAPTAIEAFARRAASGGADAPGAVAALRTSGPAGLQALLDLGTAEPAVAATPAFHTALDAVCAQFDCAASRLFWYTDLAAAREEARRTGKPILSLRLLGRLDEELSCANSRFFRSILYPDPSIAGLLRDRFVLHWESVRPVPKVTVDFGNGRKLAGTITGNSIHYVLDAQGRLVDALPGLYGPGAFRNFLEGAAQEADRTAKSGDEAYVRELVSYHTGRREELRTKLVADFHQVGAENPEFAAQATMRTALWGGGKPTALKASERTMSKSASEVSLLWAVSADAVRWLGPGVQPSDVAALHFAEARLSPESRRLLLAKADTWMKIADDDEAVVRFERLIAEDTIRNEYLLHSVLHSWLAASQAVPDLTALNERVYSNLFLTPRSDPWLGLAPQELYAVLTPAR